MILAQQAPPSSESTIHCRGQGPCFTMHAETQIGIQAHILYKDLSRSQHILRNINQQKNGNRNFSVIQYFLIFKIKGIKR